MNFIRKNVFLVLALIPMGYLATNDFSDPSGRLNRQIAAVALFVFSCCYVVQRARAVGRIGQKNRDPSNDS